MNCRSRPTLPTALALALLGLALAGCATTPRPQQSSTQAAIKTLPPAFPTKDLIGRWGLAAYHQAEDRDRTIAAAARQCNNPYVILPGPDGGVMMHLADTPTRSLLKLKGGANGKTYLGLANKPAGDDNDRIIESYNGRVMIVRWVDSDTQRRYGTMVYVRCAPEQQTPAPKRRLHSRLTHKHKAKRP